MSRLNSEASLKILVVDENPIRRAILEEGLERRGVGERHDPVEHDASPGPRSTGSDPDVVLMDLQNPSRDVLDQMFQVSRVVRRPIVRDLKDKRSISAAVEAAFRPTSSMG